MNESTLRKMIREEIKSQDLIKEGIDLKRLGMALGLMSALGITTIKQAEALPFFKGNASQSTSEISGMDAQKMDDMLKQYQLKINAIYTGKSEIKLAQSLLKSINGALKSNDLKVKQNTLETLKLLDSASKLGIVSSATPSN